MHNCNGVPVSNLRVSSTRRMRAAPSIAPAPRHGLQPCALILSELEKAPEANETIILEVRCVASDRSANMKAPTDGEEVNVVKL